ncbi:AbrB/MazE/SpoVT family DNA-binding domain-containing protein [Bacillus pseudomycoides]|uniref:hypothetical protein n=1 Tax=Bacillus pseudomycoides TaxID=64104 RepID=UPI003D25C619
MFPTFPLEKGEGSPFKGRVIDVREDLSIQIPFDMLADAGIKVGDKIQVYADFNFIYIQTISKQCALCNEYRNTVKYSNLEICSSVSTN